MHTLLSVRDTVVFYCLALTGKSKQNSKYLCRPNLQLNLNKADGRNMSQNLNKADGRNMSQKSSSVLQARLVPFQERIRE